MTSMKTVIVTGANSGIGYNVALRLCTEGYNVIMACRNETNAQAAIDKIQKAHPSASASFMRLDLSDLSSVRSFVETFQSSDHSLYSLVNNAGLSMDFMSTDRKLTKDGYEMTMATNHLGHFLLTILLLPVLERGAQTFGEARVVSVASSMHDKETATKTSRGAIEIKDIDLSDVMMEEGYSGLQAYKNSKAANVMFTYSLARKLEGSKVTANCLCPGFIPATGLNREASSGTRFFLRYILGGVMKSFTKGLVVGVDDGGKAVMDLVTGEAARGVSGKYFQHREIAGSSEESRDIDKQDKLWKISESMAGLSTHI